jgi:hypothetical protein
VDTNPSLESPAINNLLFTEARKNIATLGLVESPVGIKISSQMDKKIPCNEIRVGMDLTLIPIKLLNNRYSYQLEV